MKINKKHNVWINAPWYIKLGAIGINNYKTAKRFSTSCFILSTIAALSGLINIYLNNFVYSLISFSLTSFGISAYLYALIQIWLLSNPEVLHD